MENQHRHIKGYRDLSQPEIDLMNKVKEKAEEVGNICKNLREQFNDDQIDKRWLSIAQTDLQKGFMALVRAIAQPESF